MSRPTSSRKTAAQTGFISRTGRPALSTIPEAGSSAGARRPSGGNMAIGPSEGGAAPKAQRHSKTSTKLVLLPSGPQTKPLPGELEIGLEYPLGDIGMGAPLEEETLVTRKGRTDTKSAGERMTKAERARAGYPYRRLAAYCVAEALRVKLLAAFLKREHNVAPRVFDEAVYVMYHLPLLPGYDPGVNVRSSAAVKTPGGKSFLTRMSEAEENGYEGTYFPSESGEGFSSDGFIAGSSPDDARRMQRPPGAEEATEEGEGDVQGEPGAPRRPRARSMADERIAEVVFFAYGVVVFFGFEENEERAIVDDLDSAGILSRRIEDDAWEVEECHYTVGPPPFVRYDPNAAYPRIYNDLFTFKSPSHLLKLSVAHALAQSTLLARYESAALRVLADRATLAIPRTLAQTGGLRLRRRDALRLTGRLFRLRTDVNLVSNVLDVPELFWSEASLKDLYDAVREYMEIGPRVQVLNEKLGVASDLLDLIHNHLNGSAMERITWIIIWLIVIACLVELGEVLARLVVHAAVSGDVDTTVPARLPLSKEEAFSALESIMRKTSPS
ncbi:DUF155-domain-containing protein [Phellopilus nigrolimitatus]|nr:DUF155-domain-containing protein [Phellopilus nigrolimitatus]